MNTHRRILSIDGGGINGVSTVSFLATVEDSIQDNIANYFDLIVGTSTGGIIALGLGLGLSAKEILRFYEESGPHVFGGNRLFRWLRWFGKSKYSASCLRQAIEHCFGDKKLGDSAKRLVIPSLNLEKVGVYIYKTAHHPRFERDYKANVVDVALATAAAPTYFPIHQSDSGILQIDGGVWANNPVSVSAIEAITVLEWPRDSIKILSLGCTTAPLSVNWRGSFSRGLFHWAPSLVDVFMRSQSQGALGMAELLAGHDSVIRIDPNVPRGSFNLDDIKNIPHLKGIGQFEARKALPKLREVFLSEPVERFDAFYK